MTLQQLSAQYAAEAQTIQARLSQLRCQLRQTTDPQQQYILHRRIRTLQPMLTQCRALAQLTQHYYDRRYRHHADYTL